MTYPFRQPITILGNASTQWAAAPAKTTNYPAVLSSLGCRGVLLLCDIEGGTTFSLTFTIQGYDPIRATYFTLLASAAKSAAGAFQLSVYPGAPVTASVSANAAITEYWSLLIAGTADTPSITVQAQLLP